VERFRRIYINSSIIYINTSIKEIVENLKKLKNDKKSLNDYLIDLLGMGGNIGSIAGGISGVLGLLK